MPRILFLTCCLCFASGWAAAADYWPNADVEGFIADMVRDEGFEREELVSIFQRVQREQRALPLTRNTPERRATKKASSWRNYLDRFLNPRHVQHGRDFLGQQQDWLQKAEDKYGVDKHILVAIMGVETNYGTYTGKFNAMNVLTTLAFEHPSRQRFFRKELKNLLLLARAGNDDVFVFSSSYAGALGMPQFIPSSFRAYAVDFDGDGNKDIWTNHADAIGSIANFLKQARWQPGEVVASEAELLVEPAALNSYLQRGLKPSRELGELARVVQSPEGWDANSKVALFSMPAAVGREYWLGTANLLAISRYNPSRSYALAVHLLAEELAKSK